MSYKATDCTKNDLGNRNTSKGSEFMEGFLFVYLTFVLLWFIWAYTKSLGSIFNSCCITKPKFAQLNADDCTDRNGNFDLRENEGSDSMNKYGVERKVELTLSV